MPDPAKSDLDALNDALDAFTSLQVGIQIVSEHLSHLQRNLRVWGWQLVFDEAGDFVGVSRSGTAGEIEYPADHLQCVEIASKCEWLPKHINELWEAHPKADKALSELPPRLTEKLDALTRSPWVASVRRNCIDQILSWPGELHHQFTYAAEKVNGSVTELLEKAANRDPFPTWKQFESLIFGYKRDLIAIRDVVHSRPVEVRQPLRSGLVAVDIPQVIEDARRAAVAWNYLGGCWDGRLHKFDERAKEKEGANSQGSCLAGWFVPNGDDRASSCTIQRMPDGEPEVKYLADDYRQRFRFMWQDLNESRRRLAALLNNGDIDILNCDLETRQSLRILWGAVAAMPNNPPTFRLEGRQEFYGSLCSLLSWQADDLESRLKPQTPASPRGSGNLPLDSDNEEADIVALLRDVGHRLTTSQILSEFSKRNNIKAESTTKLKLSQLVKRGVLNNLADSRPRGYGFPDWP